VIDGEDLQELTEHLLETTMDVLVRAACPSEYPEEWDLDQLIAEVTQYYPTEFTVDDLAEASSVSQLTESLVAEALDKYAARDEIFPGGAEEARQVEREIMLQIIDQRWREHLAEMDYLREGINLRAMGQQDPLVAWQREGFEMFGQMMSAVDDDYLRYVMHVQVVAEAAAEPDLSQASYQAPADPSQATLIEAVRAASEGQMAAMGGGGGPGPAAVPSAAGAPAPEHLQPAGNGSPRRAAPAAARPARQSGPVAVGAAPQGRGAGGGPEKLGRNAPCWCGSGKKFKMCHGAS
jgi:preprotein translocase subunit SecA